MTFRVGCRLMLVILMAPAMGNAQQVGDTVRVRDITLAAPFLISDTMDSYKIENGVKTPLNTWIRTIEVGIENTDRVMRINTTHVSSENGDTTKSVILLNADDLSLRRQTVRSPSDSGTATFAPAHVWGWISGRGAAWHAFSYSTTRRVFPDDGIAPWLLELFPYELGYQATVPVFNMWRKGEQYRHLRVVGSEDLTNGAVKIPCWVVDVESAGGPPNYTQRRWVSKTSRRLLQVKMRRGDDHPEYWGVMRNWF